MNVRWTLFWFFTIWTCLGFCSYSNEEVSYRGCLIVCKSSFPKMPPFAEFRRESYFCLARPNQQGQIGHHKNHHSGKPIHTLLSRPIRSTYRSVNQTTKTHARIDSNISHQRSNSRLLISRIRGCTDFKSVKHRPVYPSLEIHTL